MQLSALDPFAILGHADDVHLPPVGPFAQARAAHVAHGLLRLGMIVSYLDKFNDANGRNRKFTAGPYRYTNRL